MGETTHSEPPILHYVGPYENWVYGVGKKYAFPAIRDGNHRYFSALVNWRNNPGVGNGGHLHPVIGGDGVAAWIPTLWHGEDNFAPRFTPMVFEHPEGPRSLSPQALNAALDHIVAQTRPDAPQAGSPSEGQTRATFRVNFPVPDGSFAGDYEAMDGQQGSAAAASLDPEQPAPAVIVAVIDDGIPFAHRNLLDENGSTRLDHCWLQSANRSEGHSHVLFGRELTGASIDALRAGLGLDEDAIYRKAGAIGTAAELNQALNNLATHGAHVLDRAAGNRESGDDALHGRNVRVIAVQLPNTIAWDTSGFGKEMYMLSAFHYVFERADRIAAGFGLRHLPLVINFSYGFSGGPHDGGSELEQAIDELILKRRELAPTALIMPSGNTFLDRLHGVITTDKLAGGSFAVPWRVQPNDRTPSYLELWFPKSVEQLHDWDISILDPAGVEVFSMTSIHPDSSRTLGDRRVIKSMVNGGNEIIGQFSADDVAAVQWRILLILAPTEPEDPSAPFALPGLWSVKLRRSGSESLAEGIQCWIQRDEDPAGHSTGARQSYFDDQSNLLRLPDGSPAQADGDTFVRRYGSLNGLATGRTSLVVGGFTGSTLKPAAYSSAGPADVPPGSPNAVGASSMSDNSLEVPGVSGAGSRSGAWARWSGTSVAAPKVARVLAGVFATRTVGDLQHAEAGNYVALLPGTISADPRLGLARV